MKHAWIGVAILSFLALDSAHAATPDHSAFDELLHRYVHDSRVDYRGLAAERPQLIGYLDSLGGIDAVGLERDDRMALFINAYNAATLLLIVEHDSPALASIKDIPSSKRWKDRRWRVAGATYSLDDLEHKVLRPEFGDPRVHTAINCASVGCPDLRAEAFVGTRLSAQLDDQAARFVNDPRHVQVKGKTLHVSSIFKWFAEDFRTDGGSVHGFILRYADNELRRQMEALGPRPKIKYLDYDWSLNRYDGKRNQTGDSKGQP